MWGGGAGGGEGARVSEFLLQSIHILKKIFFFGGGGVAGEGGLE